MRILVTGGAGYIGSHTSIVLLEQGHDVVIVDNLCNSKRVAVDRVEELSGKKVTFYQYDVCDEAKMREVFSKESIDAVIHFAGLKAVGESVAIPLRYYDNNLTSTLVLLKVMKEFGVGNFVFSSSATVYGDPASVPLPFFLVYRNLRSPLAMEPPPPVSYAGGPVRVPVTLPAGCPGGGASPPRAGPQCWDNPPGWTGPAPRRCPRCRRRRRGPGIHPWPRTHLSPPR